MSKISVIVPVYNVEEYLEACLRSIMNQTFTNLEIILIDDGSTDRSGAICNRFCETDSRIIVCHTANHGLSEARNAGIEIATGELLSFVDSDDILAKNMFEILYHQMLKQEAQLAICNYCRLDEENEINPGDNNEKNVEVFTGEQLSKMLLSEEYCVLLPVAWNKLYKRELFLKLRYPLGRYHEDEFVIHRLFAMVDRAVYVKEKLYGYRIRENSIVRTENAAMKNDKLDALQDRIIYYKENHNKDLYRNSFRYCIREIIWQCMRLQNTYEDRNFVIRQSQRVKELLDNHEQLGLFCRIKYTLFADFPLQYITVKKLVSRPANN